MQLPKCFTKTSQELKVDILKKLTDKSLLYIFYNYESRQIKQEVARLLYQKEWIYNFEEYLWFFKLNFADLSNVQFFNIKKWDFQQYQYEVRREQFAKAEDFDTYFEINENGNGATSP